MYNSNYLPPAPSGDQLVSYICYMNSPRRPGDDSPNHSSAGSPAEKGWICTSLGMIFVHSHYMEKTFKKKKVPNHQRCIFLAGGWATPSWKIWESIGMMNFPIYGKIKNVPNHQPVLVPSKLTIKCHLPFRPRRSLPAVGFRPSIRRHLKLGSLQNLLTKLSWVLVFYHCSAKKFKLPTPRWSIASPRNHHE